MYTRLGPDIRRQTWTRRDVRECARPHPPRRGIIIQKTVKRAYIMGVHTNKTGLDLSEY